MLRSAYKHFTCLNLAEVTSKNDSKPFKVTPVDGVASATGTVITKKIFCSHKPYIYRILSQKPFKVAPLSGVTLNYLPTCT